jgi:hypothetical protein
VEEDHNLWNYLYFMYYLKKKPCAYTGIESSIAEKILKDDNSWFPIGKCLKLAADDADSLKLRVDKICAAIDGLIDEHRDFNYYN